MASVTTVESQSLQRNYLSPYFVKFIIILVSTVQAIYSNDMQTWVSNLTVPFSWSSLLFETCLFEEFEETIIDLYL